MKKRVCAYFDEESIQIIEQYQKKYKGSTANLLRMALQSLKKFEELEERVPFEKIETYVKKLANMEHLIIDIADGKAIFAEIGYGSEKFWNEIDRIGQEHLKEYQDKGLRTVLQILKHVENTNWYRLNVDSENNFTLILTVSESSKFLKTFFTGLFKNYTKNVEVIEEFKKIRIRVL